LNCVLRTKVLLLKVEHAPRERSRGARVGCVSGDSSRNFGFRARFFMNKKLANRVSQGGGVADYFLWGAASKLLP